MFKLLAALGALAGIVVFTTTRPRKTGTFLGIPYDWRWPTPDVLRERMWNPADPRIFTPHAFGWGYSVNLPAVWRRLRRWLGQSGD